MVRVYGAHPRGFSVTLPEDSVKIHEARVKKIEKINKTIAYDSYLPAK
jgi:hypothetical protein